MNHVVNRAFRFAPILILIMLFYVHGAGASGSPVKRGNGPAFRGLVVKRASSDRSLSKQIVIETPEALPSASAKKSTYGVSPHVRTAHKYRKRADSRLVFANRVVRKQLMQKQVR